MKLTLCWCQRGRRGERRKRGMRFCLIEMRLPIAYQFQSLLLLLSNYRAKRGNNGGPTRVFPLCWKLCTVGFALAVHSPNVTVVVCTLWHCLGCYTYLLYAVAFQERGTFFMPTKRILLSGTRPESKWVLIWQIRYTYHSVLCPLLYFIALHLTIKCYFTHS